MPGTRPESYATARYDEATEYEEHTEELKGKTDSVFQGKYEEHPLRGDLKDLMDSDLDYRNGLGQNAIKAAELAINRERKFEAVIENLSGNAAEQKEALTAENNGRTDRDMTDIRNYVHGIYIQREKGNEDGAREMESGLNAMTGAADSEDEKILRGIIQYERKANMSEAERLDHLFAENPEHPLRDRILEALEGNDHELSSSAQTAMGILEHANSLAAVMESNNENFPGGSAMEIHNMRQETIEAMSIYMEHAATSDPQNRQEHFREVAENRIDRDEKKALELINTHLEDTAKEDRQKEEIE